MYLYLHSIKIAVIAVFYFSYITYICKPINLLKGINVGFPQVKEFVKPNFEELANVAQSLLIKSITQSVSENSFYTAIEMDGNINVQAISRRMGR